MQLDRLSEFGHEAAHQTYASPDSQPLTKPLTSLKSLQTRYPAGGHPTRTPGATYDHPEGKSPASQS